MQIHVNGTRQEVDKGGNGDPPTDTLACFNENSSIYAIGSTIANASTPTFEYPYDGYLAEFYFIDGTQYAASDFGELDSTTNQWIPKDASDLTFGNNGFYQKYAGTELADSFTDSSAGERTTAPHVVTPNGNVHTDTSVKKFGTASAQFDGTGDYLSLADSSDWDFVSSGDYTMEAWIYPTSVTGTQKIFQQAEDANNGWQLYMGGQNIGLYNIFSASAFSCISTSTPITIDTWQHVAAVKDGDDYEVFVDGVSVATVNSSTTDTLSAVLMIGNDISDQEFTGYMDEIRFSDTARYTTTFDEPETAFTPDANTLLLLHMDGANDGTVFSDQGRHAITDYGGVTQTRAVKKVGDSSIYFDGNGDYFSIPASSDWNRGTGDWTVEAWFQNAGGTDGTGYGNGIFPVFTVGVGWTGAFVSDWLMWYSFDEEQMSVLDVGGNQYDFAQVEGDWDDTDWHHIAIVRNGNDLKYYFDGIQTGSTADVTGESFGDSTNTVYIGRSQGGSEAWSAYWNGYQDEYRVSDTARYTANFSGNLPTTAFTTDSNTLLLIHSNWDGGFGGDSSGNYNNFTPTNLVATDQMIDTPTNNFCTGNPLSNAGAGMSEGNLKGIYSTHDAGFLGTMGGNSGKWYWESEIITGTASVTGIASSAVAFAANRSSSAGVYGLQGGTSYAYYRTNGSSGESAGFPNLAVGSIVQCALDLDNAELYMGVNGSFYDLAGSSADPAARTNPTWSSLSTTVDWFPFSEYRVSTHASINNFGQDSSFAGTKTAQGEQDSNGVGDFYYEPPTDFLALCSSNLPDPEIALPGDNFNTKLYTGDGATTLAVSGVGFQPDFTWIKNRDQADDHILVDSVRGATNYLVANETDAEVDDSTFVASLDSDGFTVGDDVVVNTNTENYVSWNWEAGGASTVTNTDGDIESEVSANTTAGFSIVSYTGDADNESSVGHGLTTTPGMIILKALTGTQNWIVWHKDLTATTAYSLYLNTDGAETNNVSYWYDAAPNATTFHPGDGGASNGSGTAYIAYCFESIEGYSKMGSYDGNGNADGPFIYTGFRPAYIMIRVAPSWTGGHWHIFDTKRYTYNETTNTTTTGITADNAANDGGGGGEGAGPIDILSNGFKIRNNNGNDNANGDNILYIAFAESPFKYSNAR
jgi:hypothetical protein